MTKASKALYKNGNAWMIHLDHLQENGSNVRTEYDPIELDQLAASIAEHGVLHNLLVETDVTPPTEASAFRIIAGHRRFRAAKLAQVLPNTKQGDYLPCVIIPSSVPAWIRNVIALDENLQRSPVPPEDLGRAVTSLIQDGGMTRNEVAARLHKTPAWLSQNLTALDDPIASELLFSGAATYRQALEIARCEDTHLKTELADAFRRGENPSSRELRLERMTREERPTTDKGLIGLAVKRLHEPGADVAGIAKVIAGPVPNTEITIDQHSVMQKHRLLNVYRDITGKITALPDWDEDQRWALHEEAARMLAFVG